MNNYFKHVINKLDNIENLAKKQISLNKEILNLEEASIFLGISKNHLYKHTSGGQITHSKPGGKMLLFCRQDLLNWAMSNQVCTQAEIDQKIQSQFMNSNFCNN